MVAPIFTLSIVENVKLQMLLMGTSWYYTWSQTIITEVFTMNKPLNPLQKDPEDTTLML